jgi:DNA-binding NarL/FixJ family response regulator
MDRQVIPNPVDIFRSQSIDTTQIDQKVWPMGDESEDLASLGLSDEAARENLQIAWIDSHSLIRDCFLTAILAIQPKLSIYPFLSVRDFIAKNSASIDLVVLYSRSSYEESLQGLSEIRSNFETMPLIMLSDLEGSEQINAVRGALRAGANGFISTRTTGLSMTMSAIRFVKAGGTFAPVEMLLTDSPSPVAIRPELASPYRLTLRQKAVLAQLQLGKANKIIAHELGMSESTAKVHIRNIMRKMGATNRTQAAFKALKLCPDRPDHIAGQ